jgi:hypothetical protein
MSHDALTIPIHDLAREIARHLADELRAGDVGDLIDQRASPLGSRRHISAIRSGRIPVYRIGRRWLARRDDVERHAAELARPTDVRPPSRAELLRAELRGR